MIIIDGAHGEGGGQILRISSALSHLLNEGITVKDIRKGRSVPGLKNQHLTSILVLKKFGHELDGAYIKSTELTIQPTTTTNWNKIDSPVVADTKSAGSCTLLAQMLLPVFLFYPNSDIVLECKGGTDVDFSPPIDTYLKWFCPMLKQLFNVSFNVEIVKRGFFPKGGGLIKLSNMRLNDPDNGLTPIHFTERGNTITKINVQIIYTHTECKSYVNDLSAVMNRTLTKSSLVQQEVTPEIIIETEHEQKSHASDRSVIVVTSITTDKNCTLLYTVSTMCHNSNQKKKKQRLAGDIAKEVTQFLEKQWQEGGCVCEYGQDQFILYMALANGTSQLRTGPLTDHTLSAIHVCQQMTGAQFTVTTDEDNGTCQAQTTLITCTGIGYKKKSL
jgi:RNA 3'-terminal phosphate cyclase (ATP)